MNRVTLLAWVDLDPETGDYLISGGGIAGSDFLTDKTLAYSGMAHPVKVSIEYTPPGPVPVVAKEVGGE